MLVVQVLHDFTELLGHSLDLHPMPRGALFRRSIGRHAVGINTYEDIVWFADVDHLFGPGCLTLLSQQWNLWERKAAGSIMVWPKGLWIHACHELGDAFVKDHIDTRTIIDLEEAGVATYENQNPTPAFEWKTYYSAIGGVQIVSGTYVRQFGYLPNSKWQQPRTDDQPFKDFRDDVKFRKCCLSQIVGESVDIPHVYRLRHTPVTYK
jgi:hypothetical protein